MYVIGQKALHDFIAAHPEAGPDLRALAARLEAGGWKDAASLARAFGGCAQGHDVIVLLPWQGVRVRLAYDTGAALVVVRGVERTET